MKLRDYQEEDVKFLSNLDCCACFNEPRTGKTPTAIGVIKAKQLNKYLIICPKSIMYQWEKEIKLWNPGENVVVIDGDKKTRERKIKEWNRCAIISFSYLSVTDRTLIRKQNPDGVIVDEAHNMRNYNTKRTKAVFELISIPFRMCLTGTPAASRAYSVYSILHFLYPKKYTGFWKFIDEYFVTFNIDYGMGMHKEIKGFKKGMLQVLQNDMRLFATQRKRKDILQWIPDKTYTEVKLDLTTAQKRYLKELADHFETEHVLVEGVLDRLIRYRQICIAPELLDLKGKSPKTQWLKEYVDDYPEKTIIVFSKFKSYLNILKKELKDCAIITGDTNTPEREQIRTDFQLGKYKVLLLQLDAGKEGLTLDRATTTVFMDVYPPIDTIIQAEDRFVATTENIANKGHEVINLVMSNSYEEAIQSLLKSRANEVDVINHFNKYMKGEK